MFSSGLVPSGVLEEQMAQLREGLLHVRRVIEEVAAEDPVPQGMISFLH